MAVTKNSSEALLWHPPMGSHLGQVPDDKLDCFGILRKIFGSDQNGLVFYPRPVLPPRADGSTLMAPS